EVASALLLGTPSDHHPRELLTRGHCKPRVRLVVAVLHVEARVELLDPGVLELEGLDPGLHDSPLDAGTSGDHARRARVEVADVLEVGRDPRAQTLGLAHVDHPALGVAEAVHAGLGRDGPRRGTVRRWTGHDPSLRSHEGLEDELPHAIVMVPSATSMANSFNGLRAGPASGEPSTRSKRLP